MKYLLKIETEKSKKLLNLQLYGNFVTPKTKNINNSSSLFKNKIGNDSL